MEARDEGVNNQILQSTKIKDVKNKAQRGLKAKSLIDKSLGDPRTKSSSDLSGNSDDSRDERNHPKTLSPKWKIEGSDEKEKMWHGKESGGDPKERSQEIVNRLTSRLASDKEEVSRSSENKEDKMAGLKKEKKKKELSAKEKVCNEAARKELKDFNNTKFKVHENFKEQDTNVRLASLVEKGRTNEKCKKKEGGEKKNNLKRKLEKERHANDEKKEKMKRKFAEQYFSKNQSRYFHEKPCLPSAVYPNQDSGCKALKFAKNEESGIFCNGVKVILSKPERKIALEKKIEKGSSVARIGAGASEQVYTRLDGVSQPFSFTVTMISMILMITIMMMIIITR